MSKLFVRFDVRVSTAFGITAVLWIVLSDSLLSLLFPQNSAALAALGTVKGLVFVLTTTLGLFFIVRAELRRRESVEQSLEKELHERTRTLEALRKSESRFSTIFHGSPVPTGISSLKDGHIVDVNDAFVRMMGYERDELIGHTAFEMKLWAEPEKRTEALGIISEKGQIRNLELEGRTKFGASIYLLASADLLELGDVPHIVNMFYDITERKQMEIALKESERRFRNMANTAPSMIWTTDLDGTGTFLSREWHRFTGQTEASTRDWGWLDALHPEDQQSTKNAFIVANQTQTRFQFEYRLYHQSDGEYRSMLATGNPRYSDDGEFMGFIGSVTDVTEHKKAQEELQAAALLRLELQKEKELIQLKERFISVVSHEFRTPLSVIMSSTELVHDFYERMTRERQMTHLETVLAQAQFMVGLLDDVLTVNKAQSGKLEFKPALLDLKAFCQTTLERLQAVDKGKHEFVFTSEGDLSNLRLDTKLLQHILVNLLSNAAKYSPEGGEVRLDVQQQNGDVVFTIRDQGIGIPKDSLPRLFEPFHRASNTGDISGTGLGLTIVKESVNLHQGTISCESTVGVGTTFTVRLPTTAQPKANGQTTKPLR